MSASREDIKQCLDLTKHAHLGNTGSCLCGFKKYLVKKERGVFRCPFCKELPEEIKPPPSTIAPTEPLPREMYCATEGCPAFSNVVSFERWQSRAPHELAVAHIPSDEPIFVLRAQDSLSLVPVYTWIELAEKKEVLNEKTDSAVADAAAMDMFQRTKGSKLPD